MGVEGLIRLAEGPLKYDPVGGKGVQPRGGFALVSIGTHVVCPQSIQRDQDEASLCGFGACQEHREQTEGQETEHRVRHGTFRAMPDVREMLLPLSLVLLGANVTALAWLHAQPLPPDPGPIVVSSPARPESMPDLTDLKDLDAERDTRFEARLEAWRAEVSDEGELP